jgi:hypothetical protein
MESDLFKEQLREAFEAGESLVEAYGTCIEVGYKDFEDWWEQNY